MSEPRVTVTLGAGRVARKPLSRRPPSIKGLSQGRLGMYSDQIEERPKTTIKDRLGITPDSGTGIKARLGPLTGGGNSQPVAGKRQRADDQKWQHDLFTDEDAMVIDGGEASAVDLRSRLGRRPGQRAGAGNPVQVRDLREKLSRTAPSSRPLNAPPPKQRRLTSAVTNTFRASAAPSQPVSAVQQVQPGQQTSVSQPRPQVQSKSVGAFLTSLGLAKYVAAFHAEEVDMITLQHFRDDDLKEMGIPMGPRKKILLALNPESTS